VRGGTDRGDDARVVHADLAVEGCAVGNRAVDRAEDGDRGVVDEDVQPAELLGHLADDGRCCGRIGLVRPDRPCPYSQCAHLRGESSAACREFR